MPALLWILPADGGEAEQLTFLPLGAGEPVWSPDGSRIAFAGPADEAGYAGETEEQARARRAAAPVVTERLDYQADGLGLPGTVYSHLHVCDLETATTRRLTEGSWRAGQPAWSPDGTRLAFPAACGADADLTGHSAAYLLHAADPHPGPERVGAPDRFVSTVRWAPDGQALLVVDHPSSPIGHARLLRLPLDGQAIDLATDLDRNVMVGAPGYPGAPPQVTGDGRTVLFCVRDGGCTHAYAVSVTGGTPRQLVAGAGRAVSGMAVAAHADVVAVVLGTPSSYGEVVTIGADGAGETVCTSHGDTLAGVAPIAPEPRIFEIFDGTTVHGWLIRAPETAGPSPLLLNPRGSDGYGEAFYTALAGGWGTNDAADFLEPVDALVTEGIADPRRLAISGYSYGGYMTCYLTGRDRRFAAVAGGVVSDLASMAGSSDAGNALAVHELGGRPWSGPDHYAEMSPITHADQVDTPTLILHSQQDLRCPVEQAKLWHTALRSRGVDSRLVLYPGASHLFILSGRPSHRIDANRRIADWVRRYAGRPGGPRPAPIDASHWQRRLETLTARHEVPGASLGILRLDGHLENAAGDELVEAACGLTNRATGVPVTTDTLFQIGSITKVWTATMVMQLVDEGRLDLDAPVTEVPPELRLADDAVTKTVTMRHLLTHTSGIDGDVFTDTGRGDDCLRAYVEQLAEVSKNHPLGATWSYCNAGFVLAGRIVEQLTGTTWDRALRERIGAPLGLARTVTLPEDALLHRTALGHVARTGEQPAPATVSQLPRSMGPAGGVSATAADVLRFARMHLTGGFAADGCRVLSDASATAMWENHADLPEPYSLGDSWGLGWIRFGWEGHRLVGHDGNTIGQSAFLRMLPEAGLAVVLLTNGGHTRDLFHDLYTEIFTDLASLRPPRPLTPPQPPPAVDITGHIGTYRRASMRIDVFQRDRQPMLRATATGPMADLVPETTKELALIPADDSGTLFCVRDPEVDTPTPVRFYTLPSGEPYIHTGGRAAPKVR